MEIYLKILALVLAGCAASLLLRDSGFRSLAALCCVGLCGALAVELLRPILNMVTELTGLAGVSSAVFGPVLKATAIGILTQIAGGYCKNAGEQSLAGMLELGGVLAILYVSLPLFSAAVDMLRTLMEG